MLLSVKINSSVTTCRNSGVRRRTSHNKVLKKRGECASRCYTHYASLMLEHLVSQEKAKQCMKQLLRWFPANNDIRVCLHKTLWSPLLNLSTSLRQVCKEAHGIFCDFLWLSSFLLEFFFLYIYTLLHITTAMPDTTFSNSGNLRSFSDL